ncbi:MAG: hypothetical protein Q8P41_16405 [Pseudomonadota bacterium]|nr:hypothetical protein [Pseudomonadota bacterium]
MSTAVEVGSGAPSEALLLGLRRAWRSAEGRRESESDADAIASAGQVARAVGTLLVAAATQDLRGATRGAAAGCGPGVARMVQIAVTRQVLDALPRGEEGGPEGERSERMIGESPAALGGNRAQVPAASWWCREPAWSPRLVGECGGGARDGAGADPVAAMWPPVPDGPRTAAPRPASTRRAWISEDPLKAEAWRVLEAELVPVERSMVTGLSSGGAR